MRVTDPGGATWRVRRRWLPRYEGRGLRERWRQRQHRMADRRRRRRDDEGGHWWDVLDPVLDVPDTLAGVAVAIAVVVVLALLVVLGLPLLLALVDLVVVVGVGVAGLVGRLLFRRPWTIEAVASDGRRRHHRVVGWRAGGVAIGELADQLRHGIVAPDAPAPP